MTNSISIYLVLVAIFIFQVAVNINHKLEKGIYIKGWLFLISLACFAASIIFWFV